MSEFTDAQLRQVFDAFDTDKSGEISPKELVTCLTAVWGDEQRAKRGAAYLIVLFDSDGDALLSFEEFSQGIRKYILEEDSQ